MKPFILAVVCTMVASSACSTTEYVPRNTLKVRTFDLNERTSVSPVNVSFRSSPNPLRVRCFKIIGDSALWLNDTMTDLSGTPLSEVLGFTVHRSSSHAVMEVGTLVGSALGTAYVLAYSKRQRSFDGVYGDFLTIYGSAGAGMILGYFVGKFIDKDEQYIFDNPPPPR
jgi:hypothetical protein